MEVHGTKGILFSLALVFIKCYVLQMLNIKDFQQYLPSDWGEVDFSKDYELEEIPRSSPLFHQLHVKCGFGTTYRIERIKNPSLYLQYSLHKEMYQKKGGRVVELFHTTGQHNISSIAKNNLDYRYVRRCKFGKGVSFSPSPTYANTYASRSIGTFRAMIIADVLLRNEHSGDCFTTIPINGYDGTHGNCHRVYVKFFDNEFYPKYVVRYSS